ncbi:hypothetical protein FHT77_005865 [Rhizobium sp. BK181]|uniref:hypothetical protein n=1 Tax=Rhizobium sp. BK181 TaxID=2587072 RepID=UPI0016214698|nr:hypothetical protein [Rhizobium sp. BK181]MBB3319947.1 hypothetical protein [Rhizobium sp. BK181]
MAITIVGSKAVLEGYEHKLDPKSVGQGDGKFTAIEHLGSLSGVGSAVVLHPLAFQMVGCTNGGAATGAGSGTVSLDGDHKARCGSREVLLERDTGICSGMLLDQSGAVFHCTCTFRFTKAQPQFGVDGLAGGGAMPAPDGAVGQVANAPAAGGLSDAGPSAAPSERRIVARHADGSPMDGARIVIVFEDGVTASMTADAAGEAVLPLDRAVASVEVREGPGGGWEPFLTTHPNPVYKADGGPFDIDAILEKTTGRHRSEIKTLADLQSTTSLGSVLAANIVVGWMAGALAGEFNEDRTGWQIFFDAGLAMVPVLDQVLDLRDVIAVSVRLSDPEETKEVLNWVALVISLIGLVPTVGSAVAGAARILLNQMRNLAGKRGQLVSRLADFVRNLGKGDPIAFLRKEFESVTLKHRAVELFKAVSEHLTQAIDVIVPFVSGQTHQLLTSLKKFLKLERPTREFLEQAAGWLSERMRKAIDEAADESESLIDRKMLESRSRLDAAEPSYDEFANMPQDAAMVVAGASPLTITKESAASYYETTDVIWIKARGRGPLSDELIPRLRHLSSMWDYAKWRMVVSDLLETQLAKHGGKRLPFKHLKSNPTKQYEIFNFDCGLIVGRYEDLNELTRVFGEVAKRPGPERAKYLATKSPEFRKILDDKFLGEILQRHSDFDKHHIVEFADLAYAQLVHPASFFKFDAIDKSAYERVKRIYDTMPCVVIPREMHLSAKGLKRKNSTTGWNSLSDMFKARREMRIKEGDKVFKIRGGEPPHNLKLRYEEIYESKDIVDHDFVDEEAALLIDIAKGIIDAAARQFN